MAVNKPYSFLVNLLGRLSILLLIFFLPSCSILAPLINKKGKIFTKESIHGAGATFPGPLYDEWSLTYKKKRGGNVLYDHVGSGNGIKRLLDLSVDFGGSDAFLKDEQIENALAEVIHIPTCLGAVVLTYNLPIKDDIRLTPEIISNIYLGNIRYWDDPEIQAANPNLQLPNLRITVVYRTKKSGTTYIFTNYLSKVSKKWNEHVGCAKKVNWPIPLGEAKGEDSNEDIAHYVKKTEGGIGYVQLNYAKRWKLPTASIKNSSGYFVSPTLNSVSKAANVDFPKDTRIMITNTSSKEGYPISGFTWILVYKEQYYNYRTFERAQLLVDFLRWMNKNGQKYNAKEFYAPLPKVLVRRNEKVLKEITYKGKLL